MLRSRSFDLVNRIIETENSKLPVLRGSLGSDLQDLARDRAIVTDPEETRRRRTIKLTRQHLKASWGFTLQTYGIRNKRTREVEVMSYVDYVEISGPAWTAGMKKGDVILSVNGESVDLCTHRDLVTKIQRGGRELRLVVLFEDCCKKVELQERYIKLKKLLNLKLKELRRLEGEESRLLRGGATSQANGENYISTPTLLSRLSTLRQSRISAHSSASSDWDMYSEITSPLSLDNVPVNQFAFDSSLSDVSNLSSQGSAHGSTSSAHNSSSSDSQSEVYTDVESSAGGKVSTVPKAVLSERQEEGEEEEEDESELDISSATSSRGDGDTDSQFSFLSISGSSPKMSSLTEIMTRDEAHRLPETASSLFPSPVVVGEESFRQMYTVARWVGVSSSSVRRHSVMPGGTMEKDVHKFNRRRFSSNDVGDHREITRARSLSSVNEMSEEGVNSVEAAGFKLVKNGEECSDYKNRDSSSSPTALTGSVVHQQLPSSPGQSFYVESDSETSSVLSWDPSRGRRDTVIDLSCNVAASSETDFGESVSGDHHSNSAQSNKDQDRSVHTCANSIKVSSSNGTLVSPENNSEPTYSNASNGGSALYRTSESMSGTSNQQKDLRNFNNLVDSASVNVDPSQAAISSLLRQGTNVNNTVRDHKCDNDDRPLFPGGSLMEPRFEDGILVNDATHVTKL